MGPLPASQGNSYHLISINLIASLDGLRLNPCQTWLPKQWHKHLFNSMENKTVTDFIQSPLEKSTGACIVSYILWRKQAVEVKLGSLSFLWNGSSHKCSVRPASTSSGRLCKLRDCEILCNFLPQLEMAPVAYVCVMALKGNRDILTYHEVRNPLVTGTVCVFACLYTCLSFCTHVSKPLWH